MAILFEEYDIPLTNEASSAATVVRKDIQKKLPVILIYSPYPRDAVLSRWAALALARDDWAIVVASTRGRHGSKGQFTPFINESLDTKIILDWCIKQSWSDGRVVMTGASYEGYAQWQCANGNDSLLAIAPHVTSSDLRHWFYENGAFKHAFAQSWGLSLIYTDDLFNLGVVRPEVRKLAENLHDLYKFKPELSPLMTLSSLYRKWINREDSTFFDNIQNSGNPKECSVPVYFCTGWNDIFLNGALKDYEKHGYNNNDRLVIGPWSHDSIGKVTDGDIDFGFEADPQCFDVFSDKILWFKDIISGKSVAHKVSYFLLGENKWVHTNSWPPRSKNIAYSLEVNASKVDLNQSALALTINDSNHAEACIKIIPGQPCYTFGGKKHDPSLPSAGCKIINLWLEENSNSLFISKEHNCPIDVVGNLTAELLLSCDVEVFDIYGVVGIIGKDERYISYVECINRVRGSKFNEKIKIDLGNIAFRVAKGEKLFLALSGGCFPTFDNCYQELTRHAKITFHEGGALHLPIASNF